MSNDLNNQPVRKPQTNHTLESDELLQQQQLLEKLAALESENQALTRQLEKHQLAQGPDIPAQQEQGGNIAGLIQHSASLRPGSDPKPLDEPYIREILDSISDGFFTLDRQWRFTYMNQQAAYQGGMQASELLGKVMWEAVPVIKGSVLEPIYRRVMQNRQVEEVEFHSLRSGRWFQLRVYPFADGISVYSIDITERKQAEEDLKRYAIQLKLANQDLEYANRELKDFAFIASHDLKEPLRKVIQFGELIKNDYGADLKDEAHEYFLRMIDAARRMQEMIEGLLGYSRVSARNPYQPVDLAQTTREVLSDLEIQLKQTGASIDLGSLPTIDADPLLMRQLLQNLITNALKFHRPDVPPVIQIWAEEGFRYGSHPDCIRLYIQDNGIGFDEKQTERLFLPFIRLQNRQQYEGSGMGLAICRKIARRHGGEINATSQPGKGSSFFVTLPKHQPER